MDYLVGIDLGSTRLKAVVYNLAGQAVAQAGVPTECCHPDPLHPDWAVWKPEQIWGGVAESLRAATAQLDDPARIRGVAVTGMGMDAVPIGRDGQWLYPFINWQCPRTKPQQEWWLENVGPEKQFAIGGNPIWPFNTALRLLWLREHEPQILDRTDKYLLIEDFVNFMLCGVYGTDYSMASCTLLFDQRKRTWSEELLAISGIDRRLLCEPRPSGTILGEVHREASRQTGLPKGTPVVLGGHDFLCGALPAGAFRPGVVLTVLGTWDIILAALPEPILTPDVGRMGAWVDSHVARDTWAVIGTTVAGEATEWFRREYGFEERKKAETEGGTDWDYLIKAAESSPPGAQGVLFLPHLCGSTFPVVDSDSLGAFVGLRNIVSKADLFRAVIEGLNYQFLQMLNKLRSGLGLTPDRIVAVGGGAKNRFALQNKADLTGQPIEAPQLEEATPLGAAILAGIGVGLYANEQDAFAQVHKPGLVYEPNPILHQQYQSGFQRFEQLYPALQALHHQIQETTRKEPGPRNARP